MIPSASTKVPGGNTGTSCGFVRFQVSTSSFWSTRMPSNSSISNEADEIGKAYREAFAYVGYRMNHPFSLPTWLPIPRNRRFAHAKVDRGSASAPSSP